MYSAIHTLHDGEGHNKSLPACFSNSLCISSAIPCFQALATPLCGLPWGGWKWAGAVDIPDLGLPSARENPCLPYAYHALHTLFSGLEGWGKIWILKQLPDIVWAWRILSKLGEYWSSCKVIFYQAGFHTDWACHGNRKIRWMCTILNNWCVLDAFNIWKSFYSWTSQIGHPLL